MVDLKTNLNKKIDCFILHLTVTSSIKQNPSIYWYWNAALQNLYFFEDSFTSGTNWFFGPQSITIKIFSRTERWLFFRYSVFHRVLQIKTWSKSEVWWFFPVQDILIGRSYLALCDLMLVLTFNQSWLRVTDCFLVCGKFHRYRMIKESALFH